VKRTQRRATDPVWLVWSNAVRDPNKDAKRRADPERARRLAATLSLPADQDRLKQYADELEGKTAKQEARGQQPVDKEKRKR